MNSPCFLCSIWKFKLLNNFQNLRKNRNLKNEIYREKTAVFKHIIEISLNCSIATIPYSLIISWFSSIYQNIWWIQSRNFSLTKSVMKFWGPFIKPIDLPLLHTYESETAWWDACKTMAFPPTISLVSWRVPELVVGWLGS